MHKCVCNKWACACFSECFVCFCGLFPSMCVFVCTDECLCEVSSSRLTLLLWGYGGRGIGAVLFLWNNHVFITLRLILLACYSHSFLKSETPVVLNLSGLCFCPWMLSHNEIIVAISFAWNCINLLIEHLTKWINVCFCSENHFSVCVNTCISAVLSLYLKSYYF